MTREETRSAGRRPTTLADLPPWHAAAMVVAAAAVAAIAIVLPGIAIGRMRTAPVESGVLGAAIAGGGYLAVARVSGVAPGTLYFRWPTRSTLRWAGVALGMASVVPISLAAIGDGRFVLGGRPPEALAWAVLASLALGMWAGTVEEGLLRGYVLGVLEARWHRRGAIAASAVAFGALHHGAAESVPGQAGYVAVTTAAGVALALVTIRSRNLWNAVAFHAAWNAAFSPWLFQVGPGADGPAPLVRYTPRPTHPVLGGEAVPPTESPVVLCAFVALALALAVAAPHGPTTAEPSDLQEHQCQRSRHTD